METNKQANKQIKKEYNIFKWHDKENRSKLKLRKLMELRREEFQM
jgi:hypothetical protein